MDMIKNVMDVSSFLLIEETADSEGDYLNIVDFDEDDAESCCCDTSDTQAGLCEVFECDDQGGCACSDGEHGEVSWSSCKIWSANGGLGYVSIERGEEEESSCVGIKVLGRKLKDEMEDRLFWETCMAEGYP